MSKFWAPFSYYPFLLRYQQLPSLGWQVNSPAEFLMTEESRSIHPRALPNYERAEILRSKIVEYALNPANDVGKHKARVFQSALGFDQSNWGC
jgi:hypothetical protein